MRRDAVIRIELMGSNKYENCILEIENTGIVEIVCENADKKKDLIELVTGTKVNSGVCVLEDIDTKHHLDEYKRKIDIIDIDRVDSTLNVRNYLVFYTMVTGIYSDKTMDELTQLFYQMGIEDLVDKPLNDLNKAEKIKIRCLASYLKKINCLVGKDLLEDLEPWQKECVLSILKKYFGDNHCLCLLFESNSPEEKNVDAVFMI